MAIQKTEAFVLRTQPFRSSSLIVTVFTPGFGKLRGIAKGVRREREIRNATFELFSHIEIIFYEKMRSDLHLISDVTLIESHDALRTRFDTIVYASYFTELIDRLSEVHDPHPGIFELLDFSFRFLTSVPSEKIARIFELKLLQEIGWIPYMNACLNCHNPTLEAMFFSVKQGALFCSQCAKNFPDAQPIKNDLLEAIRFYISHPSETSLKYGIHPRTLIELGKILEQFMIYRLGYPLNSRRFMDKVRPALIPQ